jgi:hypothetical protein
MNGITALRSVARERVVAALEAGRDPLKVAIDFAMDKTKPDEFRLQAAAVALPYMHPRLSMQQLDVESRSTAMNVQIDVEGARERFLARIAQMSRDRLTIDQATAEPVAVEAGDD